MIKNLKISVKLMFGFGIIIGISAIMMIIAIMNLQSVGGLTNKLYQSPFTVATQSTNLQSEMLNMGREMCGMVLYKDPSYLDSVQESIDNARISLNTVEQRFLGDKQLINDVYGILDELEAASKEINQILINGNSDEATKELYTQFKPIMDSGIEMSQEIVDFALNKALEFNENAKITLKRARVLLIILLVFIVALCLAIATTLSRSIGRPVSLLTDAAKKLAEGNLDIEMEYQSRDELGVLAEAFREMSLNIKAIIKDVDSILGAMSKGDFTVFPQVEYIGDYVSIENAIVNISERLSSTLNQINQSADLVSDSSELMSSGSQALSFGAADQASSAEELAITINEISLQVKETAANANKAHHITVQTGEQVVNTNQRMQEMISAMHEISDKSGQISRIIKTIEDFAFQTNILALNAAVEAARAGATGKGFTVVADEVRNLANKSSEASKSTSALIKDTVLAVKVGTDIANVTADALTTVVHSMNEVVSTVEEISSAAEQQANSIAQITQGINEISNVVQRNSATAEESAAASEELSGQAQMLKNLIGQFKLNEVDI